MGDPVYRIVGQDDWHITRREGQVPRSGPDESDGFVHLSTAESVLETANLYFEVSQAPVVLEIDSLALGDALKWEAVEQRGGTVFPHLYAPGIPLAAIRAVIELDHTSSGFTTGNRTPVAPS
ncbi:MAG: DUF952 domain-containing protein [Planctomycetota bacterium]|jgi:uncharacterized protein (DUF952 family)|nr:DUF952 domain-containing protein [Planctomycetota bacterium]